MVCMSPPLAQGRSRRGKKLPTRDHEAGLGRRVQMKGRSKTAQNARAVEAQPSLFVPVALARAISRSYSKPNDGRHKEETPEVTCRDSLRYLSAGRKHHGLGSGYR